LGTFVVYEKAIRGLAKWNAARRSAKETGFDSFLLAAIEI
jgi:hypothetical protein